MCSTLNDIFPVLQVPLSNIRSISQVVLNLQLVVIESEILSDKRYTKKYFRQPFQTIISTVMPVNQSNYLYLIILCL